LTLAPEHLTKWLKKETARSRKKGLEKLVDDLTIPRYLFKKIISMCNLKLFLKCLRANKIMKKTPFIACMISRSSQRTAAALPTECVRRLP